MLLIVLQRCLQALVALAVLSVVIFLLVRLSGDPVELMLPVDATMEDRQVLRATLGLDRPLVEQYVVFIKGAVTGDLGISVRERRPALQLVLERMVNSAYLAIAAMSVALAIAVPLAVASAVWRGSFIDHFARMFSVLGQSVPTFFIGLVFIIVLSGRWGLLPAGGMSDWTSYIMPSVTLGWFVVAGMMRLLRSSLLEVLDSEFVKLARIKGVPEWRVVWKHALRNALLPVVTFGGIYMALLVSTAVIVETVFAWPGVGRLAYDAVRFRDFPVTQAIVLVTAVFVVATNLAIDLLYAWVDPRIRVTGSGELTMADASLSMRSSRFSRLYMLWRAFLIRRPPWFALGVLLLALAMTAVPQLFTLQDPLQQSLIARYKPPFWMDGGSMQYPLGTDQLGRDIWARIVHGSRVSLTVAAVALLFGGFIGTTIGLFSGYYGGRLDALFMRMADSMLAFPMILFAMLLAVTLGPSMMTVVIAVSLVIWARFARIVRGEVLSLRERNFVKLAQIAGCSTPRILLVHILPNILNTLAVLLTVQLGWVIIVEASLSFLSAGIPPPMPAWGSMIAEGRSSLMRAWWVSTMPGSMLMFTVLSFNMLGDWLRDVIDPKMRQNYRLT